jgi:hypothetical protein
MRRVKLKTEKIEVILSDNEKKQIRRQASLANKSLSQYLLDAGLSTTLDTAKIEFYQTINENLQTLRKNQYIITKLLLLIGSEQLNSQEKIMKYFHRAEKEADEIFGED